MLDIDKGNAPNILLEYKFKKGANYDEIDFAVKQKIREQLCMEQHGLCAYCMRRIKPSPNDMAVGHFKPQTDFPELALEYSNMLGSCRGNIGQKREDLTCDHRKGNDLLKFSPSDKAHSLEGLIRYLGNGFIECDDKDFEQQLVGDVKRSEDIGRKERGVLNLNERFLVLNRKKSLEAFKNYLDKLPGRATRADLEQFIAHLTPEGEYWAEYAAVPLYFSRRRLAALPK
jgi:uncharacterized protein (TIGR02646 family)